MIILRLHLATFSIAPLQLLNLAREFYMTQAWYDPEENGVLCIAFKDKNLSLEFRRALISFCPNN